MAYIWGRPNLSPKAATQAGVLSNFVHWSIGVPPQFLAERPCPLWVGCNQLDQWRALDPVYEEYRDSLYPQMGTWPPPQPTLPLLHGVMMGPAYTTWVQQQRQWMPYEYIAYSGNVGSTSCADVLGAPNADNSGQTYHFDFSSSPDWPYVTAWTGVRLVAQMNYHNYITNAGHCNRTGPVEAAFWVRKNPVAYPSPPLLWGGGPPTTLIQSFNLGDRGDSIYTNPYGYNVGDYEFETTANPGGGAWDIPNVDNYWFTITQSMPGPGGNAGSGICAVRKVWAAAIVTLGGTPAPTAGSTAHTAVVG